MTAERSPADGVQTAPGTRLLRAAATPSWLDRVQDLLEDLWRTTDVPAEDRMRFATAVAEVAANIVEHASTSAAVRVRLVLQAVDGELRALFEDHGTPLSRPSTAPVDGLPERGRGLAMARALTDELVYERDGPVNRWLAVRTCR